MALHLALDSCADEEIFAASGDKERRETIRIIEKYLTRKLSPLTLGDPSAAVGVRAVSTAPQWLPSDGRASLNQRYSVFVDPTGATSLQYPLIQPADAAEANKWIDFSQTTLGFVPSIYETEQNAWQTFLRNEYRTVADLNAA